VWEPVKGKEYFAAKHAKLSGDAYLQEAVRLPLADVESDWG
jgi:hypothetical protein